MHEAFYATLLNAGFSRRSTVQATRMFLAYTEVFAVDEINGWLDPEDRSTLEASLAHGVYPLSTDLIDEIVGLDADADFEFGLNVLLNGLEADLKAQGVLKKP